MKKVAVVTMQYNEAFYVSRWIDYYAGLVGRENLYVIDHDSDDEVRDILQGVSTVRYPRAALDDQERARFASKFVGALLELYETVIYCDCDEFISHDPRRFASFGDWLEGTDFDYSTCVGFNVMTMLKEENAILLEGQVLRQRAHVRFVSPMCKTLIVRKPIRWGGGFHHANQPPHFHGAYLFHLKYADLGERMRRQALTRGLDFAQVDQGHHQRSSDLDLMNTYRAFTGLERRDWEDEAIASYCRSFLDGIKPSERGGEVGTMYVAPLDIAGTEAWRLPESFRGLF
ncbi:MAG: glycosyltransferase family 2 protein [Bosea sp.]|uniref:glycosyltransferase family 2 protein n=1 Tax=Bosea sp. (in: a-proteobacteria) TaxID=1871050 RepID=UPI001AC627C7|nr:glycosyltransferase family 2 protein [Bosea sp. (in: a-proteobacteria)]MBN9451229.1 glycosyltransferase family 2 protein [Bosea sp. (in: a-proteobacteria)]